MSRYDVPKVMPPQRLPNWFPASIEAWNGEKGADPLREIPNLKMELNRLYMGKPSTGFPINWRGFFSHDVT